MVKPDEVLHVQLQPLKRANGAVSR